LFEYDTGALRSFASNQVGALPQPTGANILVGTPRRVERVGDVIVASTTQGQFQAPVAGGSYAVVPEIQRLGPSDIGGLLAMGSTTGFYAARAGTSGRLTRFDRTTAKPDTSVPADDVLELAVGANECFWSEGLTGSRLRGPFSSPRIIAETQKLLIAFAVDETHVYFADPDANEIRRAPRANGPVERVAKTSAFVTILRLDGDDVFYATDPQIGAGPGGPSPTVSRVSRCGGPPLVLLRAPARITGLVVTSQSIYVSTEAGLVRTAR
jgi:hypothetical protein